MYKYLKKKKNTRIYLQIFFLNGIHSFDQTILYIVKIANSRHPIQLKNQWNQKPVSRNHSHWPLAVGYVWELLVNFLTPCWDLKLIIVVD